MARQGSAIPDGPLGVLLVCLPSMHPHRNLEMQVQPRCMYLRIFANSHEVSHSWRSASVGSTRVARRAGSQAAKKATAARNKGTVAKDSGSVALTP